MNDPKTHLPTNDESQASGTLPQTSESSTHSPPPTHDAQVLPKFVPTPAEADETPTRTMPQAQVPVPKVPSLDSALSGEKGYFASSPYHEAPSGTVLGTNQNSGLHLPISQSQPKEHAGRESRFTYVRELAKGGMGQVSVAVDQELDRQVALKEIQLRYARDRSVTARFLLEARVTGRLEHPGIVPVYGLNQYPDGRPYYAMRFISGESLQEAVQSLHRITKPLADPQQMLTLRQLLRRFVDVCNTIAYAHNRGILHRDLKPANIMLGAYGETLVVDWGLAKDLNATTRRTGESTQVIPALANERYGASSPPSVRENPEVAFEPTQTISQRGNKPYVAPENLSTRRAPVAPVMPLSSAEPPAEDDEDLTEIGKAMGTPAFMAPEQADGRWDDVGPSADIYSLGATLYSILTGKAPFRGQTNDILERVKRGEFTPIMEIKPDCPKPLIAVCEKAMAADPMNRYISSLDLAADVERWMADEPVSAYREPWHVRLHRWANRHRNIMFATTGILITALTTITIGFVMVNAEQKRTTEAKTRTEEAYGLLQDEEKKVREAYVQLQDEEKKVREARNVATQNREEAREALLALTDDAIGEVLAGQQSMTAKQREFLQRVLSMYQRFVREAPESHDSKLFVAGATTRIGRLQFRLGEVAEAEKAFQNVFSLAPTQTNPDWEHVLGDAHLHYGILLNAHDRFTEAETQMRKGRERFFQLVTAERNEKRDGKPEHWHRLGQTEDRLGLVLYRQSNHEEAEAWFRNSLANRETLLQLRPDVPEYEYRIAQSLRQVAMVCNSRGERFEALESTERAKSILTKLLKADPTSAVYLVFQADLDGLIGTILMNDEVTGQTGANPSLAKVSRSKSPPPVVSERKFKRSSPIRYANNAVETWSQLVGLYPSEIGYRHQLAGAHINLAGIFQQIGSLEKADRALRAATLTLDDLERRGQDSQNIRMLRGRIAHLHAILKRENSQYREAEKDAREAISHVEQLLTTEKANARWENDLAYYQLELAATLLLQEKPLPAEETLSRAWDNITRSTTRPGVTFANSNLWKCVRGYGRLYADLLSDIKRYDQVDVVANRILAMNLWPAQEQFEVAALYGRAAILVIRDKTLDLPKQQQLADDFVQKSLRLLQKLENKPLWKNAVMTDPDLAAVRYYEEFDDVIAQFRETAPAAKEK